MRTIKRTHQFKQDYRRVLTTPRYANIDPVLSAIIELLAGDRPLPVENRDHALGGNWIGSRDCHVRPDLVLIYTRTRSDLILNRLGSHAELFKK
jgi:mRNA interferase YafQ